MNVLRYLPRFRQASREMPAWEARESWSRGEIEVYQLERINEIWRHARRHVPYYRQLGGSRSLPEQFADLAEFKRVVPILARYQVAEDSSAFLSEVARRGRWHRTSGSTGTPLRAFRSHEDHCEMLRARYRFYSMWGHGVFDRMVWVWGMDGGNAPGLAGGLARARHWLHDGLRRRLRLSASQLGTADLRNYLRRIEDFRPAAIYGYSRAVYLLAQEAMASGFHGVHPRFVILTGEAASSQIIETVSQAFRAPAIREYGSVECGFVAGEWPDGALRVRDDIVLAETLRRTDGLYDIVLTILTNRSFPLIRYRIGDLTSAPLDVPQRGFAILKDVAGRSDDLLVSKKGRRVHAASVDEFFELECGIGVRCYRVHQNRDGGIRAVVQLKRPELRIDTSAIERGIAKLLDGYPVEVRIVQTIPPAWTGKHRLVTSDL